MAVDAELLKLLICPNCHGEVVYREKESVIACVGECKYEYPVVDDIP
ncbi:MAG: Trm112 family protein, partial [Acidimicrobiia bacterium]